MAKFQVGQLVRAIQDQDGCPIGTIAKITGLAPGGVSTTIVHCSGLDRYHYWAHGSNWYFKFDRIAPYEESPFKKSLQTYIDRELR